MRSMGLNPTQKEIADAIDEMDKNGRCSGGSSDVIVSMHCLLMPGNHRLDFQEFATFMGTRTQDRDQEAELREAFRLFDRDNSGFITTNELKQVAFSLVLSLLTSIPLLLRQDHAESG